MLCILMFIVGLNVQSRVDSVIIYADRAMVTRVAYVFLDQSTELAFDDLPGALREASVRITAPGLRIGEVQVRKKYTKEPHPKVKQLQEKLGELRLKKRMLADETLVLKEKEVFLKSLAAGEAETITKEIATSKVSPSAWQQGLKFLVDELLATKARKLEIDNQLLQLNGEMGVIQIELQDIRTIFQHEKMVTVDVRPATAMTYTIMLSYILDGANWQPYYEVRANPSSGKLGLSYFGNIYQRTGEDWNNVSVVLSTAKPALAGKAPVPEPWYVRQRSPREKRTAYTEEESIEVQAIAVVATPPPIEPGISVWYPLPGKYTMESGEPSQKVKIYETDFDADFEYFILPRRAQVAYSTGRLQNTSNYLFLSGRAGTYVGDDYTGSTALPTIAPDESTTISLGIDEQVRINREMRKSKVSKGGFWATTTKYEFTYENSIQNFHDKEVQCTLVDQVPVSYDKDVKVSNIKLDPKPSEEDKDRGIYYWNVKLARGEKYIVTVSFTVEAPGGKEIEGLMP